MKPATSHPWPGIGTLWLPAALLLATTASAQVIRDGSIGPAEDTQIQGPDYRIDERFGATAGSNLFHSFAQFDLAAGESALFTGPGTIDNIIARITGGSRSHIDGAVIADIPGANLYLLNPAGLFLGPDASISVEGSLYLSSADTLSFGAAASLPSGFSDDPLLSIAAPSAFGFLTPAPASIELAGASLSAADGASIGIVGGDLSLRGAGDQTLLRAASGQVALLSLAAAGSVNIAGDTLAAATATGAIRLSLSDADIPEATTGDTVEDGEDPPPIAQINVSGERAGLVVLRGGSLEVEDFVITANTLGGTDGSAGGIRAAIGETIAMSGESLFVSSSEGAGSGGTVDLRARVIELGDETELLSDALAAGSGGQVRLEAERIGLSGDAEIASDAEAGGAGGSVEILTGRLSLSGNPEISSDTDPDSTANGGDVRITASEALVFDITRGEEAGIFTNSEGAGDAGAIRIDTPLLQMQGGVITAETSAAGSGGDVIIDAERILMRDGASIAALSSGDADAAGDAGNVALGARLNLDLDGGSSILTQSEFSDGGNIRITGDGLVLVRNGRISANVGDGVGGNLAIDSDTVVLHGTEVVAQAGAGQGGAIGIAAARFFESETLISASSETGISGTVDINAPEIDLSGSLSAPNADFLDVSALLQSTCAARDTLRERSSFTVARRRGLPADASGLPLQREGLLAAPTDAELTRTETDRWIDISARAREAVRGGEPLRAAALLEQAERGLGQTRADLAAIHARIHLALSMRELAASTREADAWLLRAHALLDSAADSAAGLGQDRARAYALGNLARLYADTERLDDALRLARLAEASAETADAPESIYRWHWLQAQLLWRQGRANAALEAFRAAVAVLEASRQEAFARSGGGVDFFRRSIAPVYLELVQTLLEATELVAEAGNRQRLLREARATIENFRAAELRDYFSDPCITELQARSTSIDALADQAAIVYPILLPDRLELLVTLPDGLRRYSSAISLRALTRETRRLRAALQQTGSQRYQASARRLYDWLIRPLAGDLAAAGVDTLVLVPDGPLRSIPFAALMDGETFLIERYAIAVTPGLQLVDAQPLQRDQLQVLLAGLSDAVQGFSALPNVPAELDAVRSLFGGQLLLNDGFRLDALEAALDRGRPGLVHIASHAQFGGEAAQNFVLAYDGQLTMEQLADFIGMTRFRRQPLELLVLSACQTAVGDDRAALGLAGVAVRAGARSVLGSLWSIADAATAELVQHFYANLSEPGTSRAAALRAAQLELLSRDDFRHPFFWSPFLLISNWL